MDITGSIADNNGSIAGRAELIVAAAHKAGRFAAEIKAIADEVTRRVSYETNAEFQLRMADIAVSLVLDDIREARAKLAALPVGPMLEIAA